MADTKAESLIVPAGGVHVVLPSHFSPENMGMIVPKTEDGRVVFFLPWEGGTIAGTTDHKTELTMLPKPTEEEVEFIIRESARHLDRPILRSDVKAAWCGIRPLVKDPKRSAGGTKAISREHVVETLQPSGLVSIMGGKWTTYRKMAEDAVDEAIRINPKLAKRVKGPCITEGRLLIGADRAGIVCSQKFHKIFITLRESFELDHDVALHLSRNYGTRSLQIAKLVQDGYGNRAAGMHAKRLHSKHPFLEAEVVFAVKQEYAVSAVDVIARRTRLAFVDADAARAAVPRVVELMSPILKWSWSRQAEERRKAEEFISTMESPIEEEK